MFVRRRSGRRYLAAVGQSVALEHQRWRHLLITQALDLIHALASTILAAFVASIEDVAICGALVMFFAATVISPTA